ncbi:uncharacterized protein LOC125720673 isoform X2 [Brienomyrus brachyistius]|uniref:uncharacterized protein LOC125720673 isoform X2 n=1 Tax=Brienomyrus brachyistius TaxID=42636 RepID=UPI0020B17F49|nr:uncharacterized protein LOC125720673 isoform X2 [Brienomyrus brachyistius]
MDKMAVSLLTLFLIAVVTRTDVSPVMSTTSNLTTDAALSSTSSPTSHPVINTTCPVLQCQAGPEHKQLAVFKVFTVLLCALLLLAFGPRAYKAVLKRISDRRKDRWIGPMQSQSDTME